MKKGRVNINLLGYACWADVLVRGQVVDAVLTDEVTGLVRNGTLILHDKNGKHVSLGDTVKPGDFINVCIDRQHR